jgi:uncharacterized membrane protein
MENSGSATASGRVFGVKLPTFDMAAIIILLQVLHLKTSSCNPSTNYTNVNKLKLGLYALTSPPDEVT